MSTSYMSPADVRCEIRVRRLVRLGEEYMEESRARWLMQPGFDSVFAPPVERELCALWVAAARDGGFRFLEVFPPADDVALWTSDSVRRVRGRWVMVDKERYEAVRAAAIAGGLDGMLAAWAAGVPLSDILPEESVL